MVYYSRKDNLGNKENLIEHLQKTGALCSEFTEKFSNKNIGLILGEYHDLGKASNSFQKVLDGKLCKIDHAIVGAWVLSQNYASPICKKENIYIIFNYLSKIIAAHHSFLKDIINEPIRLSTKEELELFYNKNEENENGKRPAIKSLEEYFQIKQYANENNIKFSVIAPNEIIEFNNFLQELKSTSNNQYMFFTRMLLSCLVDADYSASIDFSKPDYISNIKSIKLKPSTLLNNLISYRNEIKRNSKANVEINKLRNYVFDCCYIGGTQDRNVFTLTAPTGTAKTLALLAFALNHAQYNKCDKIFIVLPYLSIIEQNVAIYKQICGDNIVIEDDSNVEYDGENKDLANRWGAPIIVTSSVKFFETLFKSKSSSLRKLHNIANSVIVFDESQTFSSEFLGCTLDIINSLPRNYNTSVLFSTATPLSYSYRKDIDWKPIELIKDPQKLYDDYSKVKNIDVKWDISKKYTYFDLYKSRTQENTLYIFNTVKLALKMYRTLLENGEQNVYFISSHLCKQNKTDNIVKIKRALDNNENCIVISTQCIEAGVDLSFKEIFRQDAPYSSIVQSSGRCVRNAEDKGHFVIFSLEDDTIKENNKYPTMDYRNSAINVKQLIENHSGYVDLNNLSMLDEYSKYFFGNTGECSDKKSLTNAIKNTDYKSVEMEYKLIEDNQSYTFIVPYIEDLYDDISNVLNNNNFCLTKEIMQKSKKICVNLFASKKIEEIATRYCTRLNVLAQDGYELSNWFIVNKSDNLYDETIGLNFLEEDLTKNTLIF